MKLTSELKYDPHNMAMMFALNHDICDGFHLIQYVDHNFNMNDIIDVWVESTDNLTGKSNLSLVSEFTIQNCIKCHFVKSHERGHPEHTIIAELCERNGQDRKSISIFDLRGKCLRNFAIPEQISAHSVIQSCEKTGEIYFINPPFVHVISQEGVYLRFIEFNIPGLDNNDKLQMSDVVYADNDHLLFRFSQLSISSPHHGLHQEILKFDKTGKFISSILLPNLQSLFALHAVPHFPSKLLIVRTTDVEKTLYEISLKDFDHPEVPEVVIQTDIHEFDCLFVAPNGKITIAAGEHEYVRFYQ